ncbi:MAG: hypothetical protein QM820_02005 [Minicystis sp.]
MRHLVITAAALATFLLPETARAWDGPDLWYADAAGKMPGGGGIIGTGSARDRSITCAHCHMNAAGQIDVKLDFSPPLPTVGGQATYAPGQTYQVSVQLVGEHLGQSGCGQYLTHVNNFAAAFEDVSGQPAGALASDSGQSSKSCPPAVPSPINGTTVLYGDCHAVTSSGKESTSAWSFSWTAPAGGTGAVTVYYGAVDGNCDMMSMGDDVKVGKMKLGEATAMKARPASDRGPGVGKMAALLGIVPVGMVLTARRRRGRRAA